VAIAGLVRGTANLNKLDHFGFAAQHIGLFAHGGPR